MNNVNILYSEVSSAIRHYSTCIMNTRTTVVVQGIVFLGLAGYTLRYNTNVYYNFALISGFLFAYFLKLQHLNYLADFNAHIEHVDKLEKVLYSQKENGEEPSFPLPWTNCKDKLDDRKKEEPPFWYRLIVSKKYYPKYFPLVIQSGPFHFFMGIFLILFFLSICGVKPSIEKQAEQNICQIKKLDIICNK